MPLLDVAHVLFCPEFMDVFNVRRSSETVGKDGELRESQQTLENIPGVIVPTSKVTLQRLADASNMVGSVEVYTTFRLTSGRGHAGADVIDYRGAQYSVMEVWDYTAFGTGFVHGVCTLLPLNPREYEE